MSDKPADSRGRTIESLAIEWAEARRMERWLENQRARHICAREWSGTNDGDDPQPEIPCWKVTTVTVEGYHGPVDETGPFGGDRDEWCATCQARQGYHDRLVFQRRRRAGLQSALYLASIGSGNGPAGGGE